MIDIIKKNGKIESFNFGKIIDAVGKSCERAGVEVTEKFKHNLFNEVYALIHNKTENITVSEMHEIVQLALSRINEKVYREYFSYRDYKKRFSTIFDNLLMSSGRILHHGDKENANKNSMLVSTKKGLLIDETAKQIMLEYEMPKDIAEAHKNGDAYVHDLGDRLFNSINCCLFDMGNLLENGFHLNGIDHTEPTSTESFMRVCSDIILEASSQQYGGFTVAEIDKIGAKYVKKGLENSKKYYRKVLGEDTSEETIELLAENYVQRALEQGFQAVETRLNTISNSNMQTPFITFTYGLDTSKEGRMITKALLNQRMDGVGKQHLTALFPKIAFLYRGEVNGNEGSPNHDLYDMSIECISKRMYPDMLSLDAGYLGEIYDEYQLPISGMGCRAYLSPYFPKGSDKPVFNGRANCGAITLNTVRYAIESKGDEKKYFELLDKNFDLATKMHLWTFNRMKDTKASSNPLFFCEGGCHIKLGYDETIERAIRTFTWSYGYIGLNEASLIMTGKETHEDNSFAIKVLEHLTKRNEEAKKEHGLMFALYGTPAEGLSFKFRDKDFDKYGAIKGVTDKPYYMNSFHSNVDAKISPIDKQRIESPMFNLSTGGRIQYVEMPNTKNKQAIKQVVDNGMKLGLYQGINVKPDTCNDCYAQNSLTKDNKCGVCGSTNVTKVGRVCGYAGYESINGDTRYNKGKIAEVKDRVNHTDLEVEI